MLLNRDFSNSNILLTSYGLKRWTYFTYLNKSHFLFRPCDVPELPFEVLVTFVAESSSMFSSSLSPSYVSVLSVDSSSSSCTSAVGRIEAVGSDGHLRSCPSGLGGVVGCREIRRYDRLAGTRRIRVGTWNVGSLTGKRLELADALGRHKVDIACFQETKWKGSSTREGNGYKLWCGDRIMALSVVIEGETVNVISAYAPQVGLSDAIKKKFWDDLDEIVRECPTNQHLFIGGDLNGHIGSAADGYAGVHGGFGFGARMREGRAILEGDLRTCKDCRAFPSEACSSQHRLVTLDVLFERQRHRREAIGRAMILWKILKGDMAETFKATVSEKLLALDEDMSTSSAKQMWNTLAHTIKDVARDSLGVVSESARTHSTHRESWWFSEEVQTKVSCETQHLRLKENSFSPRPRAKDKAYKDLYKKLDSKEGANDIYKIVKARERRRRDLGNVRNIKDEGGRTIVREEDIRKRWGEYFCSLFNECRPEGSEVGSSSPLLPQDYYYSRINQREVRIALQKMGRNKVVGLDQIPIRRGKVVDLPFQQDLFKRKDA
ncbi:retrovirus-related pol polyprotein LINE-1 [Tanacetum coccineum]